MATPMATAATSTDSRQCRLHSESVVEGELVPIAGKDRIQALDIIRGFALIGIFLMNVEWFTRPITELGTGVDGSQHGIDYAASWLIYTFVQGKFWTMFSLLFGMGFAVMFTRAESSERDFVTPYVRRIIGLFLFGSAHFVLIWTGDILHNYALTAIALLLIVSNSWRAWAGILGSVAVSAGLVWWFDGEFDAVIQAATLLGVVALLMHKLHTGPLRRYYQWGAALYSLPFVAGLLFWAISAFVPQFMHQNTTAEVRQRHQEFEQQASEHQHDRAGETRIYTRGSYAESVLFRARQYRDELLEAAGLTFLALPMFLIGFWFVRSGVIGHWQENLPLFRRLAAWTLPLGLAMTLTSVLLKPSYLPTPDRDLNAMLADRLFMWAMMPTSASNAIMTECIRRETMRAFALPSRFGSENSGDLMSIS